MAVDMTEFERIGALEQRMVAGLAEQTEATSQFRALIEQWLAGDAAHREAARVALEAWIRTNREDITALTRETEELQNWLVGG